jgi:hypothetical protein
VFSVARTREISKPVDRVWRSLAAIGGLPDDQPGWTSRIEPLEDGALRHHVYRESATARSYTFELIDPDARVPLMAQSIDVRARGNAAVIELRADAPTPEVAAWIGQIFDEGLRGLDDI